MKYDVGIVVTSVGRIKGTTVKTIEVVIYANLVRARKHLKLKGLPISILKVEGLGPHVIAVNPKPIYQKLA